jgi:hypothetical protein
MGLWFCFWLGTAALKTANLCRQYSFHGPRVVLDAPDMPPMGLSMERLAAGAKTRRYRTTANTIFLVTEGTGETTIGDCRFSWRRGDTLAAPGWYVIIHRATSDAPYTLHVHAAAGIDVHDLTILRRVHHDAGQARGPVKAQGQLPVACARYTLILYFTNVK